MADNHFDLVIVWDNLGGAVRVDSGGRATVTDPTTGNLVPVVQNGQTVTTITADRNGRVSFVAQQGQVKLTAGGMSATYISAEQAAAGAANAAAAQSAQAAAEHARDDAQAAQANTSSMLSTKVSKGTLAVNVRDYGATGNGSTDDTTAIMNAQADAISLGQPLYFPAGRYLYSSSITAQAIVGDGRQRTILSYTGTGNAVDVYTPGVQSYHRRIEKMTITTSTGTVGIHLDAVAGGHFENLQVDGFQHSIWLRSTTGLPRQCLYNVFIDVTVSAITYGFRLDDVSNENWFFGCRVNSAARGWQVNSGGHNVWMSGALENCSTRGIGLVEPGGSITRANVIAFSRFESNAENIGIFANVEMTSLMGNRLIGGTFNDAGTGTIIADPNTGAFRPARYATTSRPTAAAVGQGGMIYDTTLGKPIWSTGTAFKDAAGTTV